MSLVKKCLVILTICIQSCVAGAQTSDPTFNGLANVLHCNMSTSALCTGPDTCVLLDDSLGQGGNMRVSLIDRRAGPSFPTDRPDSMPIKILEASPASFNSTLFVKFEYPNTDKGSKRTGLLLFFPRQNGGFDIRFGQTIEFKYPGGSPAYSKAVTGGQCEISRN